MAIKKTYVLAFLVFSSCAAAHQVDVWRQFVSPGHFSTMYPDDWHRINSSPERLDILSSNAGAKAIVVKNGQANIKVFELTEYDGAPLSDVIDRYTHEGTILSRREITKNSPVDSCRKLTEVIVMEPVIPPEDSPIKVPDIVYTDFFCEIGSTKFITVLKNFDGDKRQMYYRKVALRMAESIRVSRPVRDGG
jgi:hypothetical protein